MADPTYVDIDRATKKPLQSVQPQTQPVTNAAPAGQPQEQGFDVEKFSADSATRQMMFAYQHGLHPTQGDFEEARKAAYQQGMETMRQMQLDKMRQEGELRRQVQMRTLEQFGPRVMSEDEVKDASGLINAHNQIMMLYHQNQDIPENDAYRTTAVGGPAAALGQNIDPRIRLYEATRGGSIISLGRGLLQDTGQVAGKDEAQTLIKQLMPGPGDSSQMAGRKTADMIQMEMNGLLARIQALPQNVDSSPLKQAYANAYNDYAAIVNQSGSDAQKNYPAQSPQQLWGQNAPATAAQSVKINPANQAAVQSGFSQATNDTLTAQANGKPALPAQAAYTDLDPQTKKPLGGTVWSPQPPAPLDSPDRYQAVQNAQTPLGAAAQQAGQYAGGSTVWTPENMPPTQMPSTGFAGPALAASAQKAAGKSGQAIGAGAQSAIGWLQGLLPENWPQTTAGQF